MGPTRVNKIISYLPLWGWQPILLTTDRYGSLPSDTATHIYRADDLFHSTFRRLHLRSPAVPHPAAQAASPLIANESPLGRLRDQIMVPDTKLGWLLPAVRLGQALIKQYRPQLIFSSSPPETAHLIALNLHRQSGLPWIADLRDGWLFEPPQAHLRQSPLRRRLESWLERQMAEQAGWITTATTPIEQDLRQRYSFAANKISTLTNGYDEAEFAGLSRQRPPDGTFRLVHTGGLAASRQGTSAEAFWEGLAALVSFDPATPLRVHFIGNLAPWEKAPAQARGLSSIVTFSPPVSQREAHQQQLDADSLLLVTAPNQRSVATLKLFDYIGAGVPILALAQNNAAAQIIEQYHFGITVPPDDPAAISQALRDIGQQPPLLPGSRRQPAEKERFEWRHIIGQLGQFFEAVVR
jgi:glycosyltransferase involved in cell wall biosynthesis